MPILFNEKTKEFHLQSSKVSYILKVLENNQLSHVYFGKHLNHQDDFTHLFHAIQRNNTSYINDTSEPLSLDLIKQEYPAYGTTDFREPAHQILQEDGSRITNFEYVNNKIYKGKRGLEGLPATYVESEDEATTLEITLYDRVIETELILSYTIFETYHALTRSARFVNRGSADANLLRALSASFDLNDSEYEMVHLSGSWARERHVKKRPLQAGLQSIASTRGTSSAQQNPFIALKRPETTENVGEVYGMSLVYSGNFLAQVEVDHYDVTRVMMGINPFDFNWLLEAGGSFQTPEVVMVYSDKGLNGMSQIYHQLYQNRLARGKWRDQERPVLINNWEGTYFDFNETKILEMAKEAKQLGVELFVLDDGWFGKRNDDTTSLGDWFVDRDKLPNGIAHLANEIRDLGLDFGLWFEPEMVSPISQLYIEHPDWIIHVADRDRSQGRNQYVLDFSREEVVDHIFEVMAAVLKDAPISYVKWDMNRYMTEIGSVTLPPERQQELPHRYILGVYQLYERLITAFPTILFESCSSGGCRFDPGMLYYAPQAWTSDNTDAVERLMIQYGTSMVYPISSMGAHVSAVPNHQVNRITSMDMRAAVAYFGMFGYELDVTTMSDADKEKVSEQVRFYQENRKLIQTGRFYRLLSPFEGDQNNASWMVVSEDKQEALVGYYQILSRPNPVGRRIRLTGLDPEQRYQIDGIDGYFYGDQLLQAGIEIDRYRTTGEHGDFTSELFKLTRV
ncbi:alpha-galactosidase [Paraliobacillus sediminis]|uniref:alpha-galactosidase n=1 Tax=Paraliobacillus sediminis TaxID=1885916 RepID=UPI000E3BE559|nr:alpha-galactosidase [Paraliobacillus sediminis]